MVAESRANVDAGLGPGRQGLSLRRYFFTSLGLHGRAFGEKNPIGKSRAVLKSVGAGYLVESRQGRADVFASGVSYDASPTESFMVSNTQFWGSSADLVKVKTIVRWPLAL